MFFKIKKKTNHCITLSLFKLDKWSFKKYPLFVILFPNYQQIRQYKYITFTFIKKKNIYS